MVTRPAYDPNSATSFRTTPVRTWEHGSFSSSRWKSSARNSAARSVASRQSDRRNRVCNWAELTGRLGYKRYVAQGGDWSSVVSDVMARQALEGLLGIRVNMPATVPPDVAKARTDGGPAPSDVEKAAFESLDAFYKKSCGYAAMMVTRPQTLGYGLADRPLAISRPSRCGPRSLRWHIHCPGRYMFRGGRYATGLNTLLANAI
jgi:hypothetical protein